MSKTHFVFWVAIIGTLTTPVGAQNLLTNPHFDSDTTSWTFTSGRVDWIFDDGNPNGSGPGCMETGGFLNNSGWSGPNQEVAVEPDTAYLLSGSYRIPAASAAQGAALWVRWYNDAHQMIADSPIGSHTVLDGPWTSFSHIVTSPPNAASAKFRPGFNYASGGTIESYLRWDDVAFEPGVLFVDGFESGDFSEWTTTQPD